MKRWFALAALVAAAPLVLATAHSATAQTAEQLEQQYGREAMAQALEVKRRYDLYGIHFETGKTAIQQDSQSLLDDIAAVMKQFPDWRLEIVGHTDAAGDPAQNEALSRARADAVKAALVQRGIEAGRLEPEGMGEAQPVASNDTPDGRALNRRVELVREDQKPNILFIMGDDIGWFNIGAYHQGIMSGKTPNLDKLAAEGMRFTDYYAEASCTAGRANFITGELPIRTGLTTVGQAGADVGMPAEAVTLATVLKAQGYETGQFGKNHLGDLNKFLPTVHGFDEFFGYLYHLDAMSDPYWYSFPQDQMGQVRPTQPRPFLGHRHGRPHRDAALGQGRQAADRGRGAARPVPEHDRAAGLAGRPQGQVRHGNLRPGTGRAQQGVHGQGQEGRQAVLHLAQPNAHARLDLHPAQISGDDELPDQLRPGRSRHGADGRQHRRRY